MNLEELLRQAKDGNMVAQYDLAEYYGKLLKETENEDEIFNYSREAMLWLKKSAKQGYGPAMDAVSELNVRPEAADKADEMDAAAETMAAAVAAAMDGLDAGRPAPEAPVQEKRGSDAEPVEPAERPAGGGSSGANIALSCMLGISLLLNILLLIFLFKLTRERRVPPAPTPPVISDAPMTTPEPTPEPTPEATPEPTPEATPEVTPEPTPEVTEEPFWLDLTAYPELELKPAQDELYDKYAYYIVTADSLNVRSGPDTRYQKLGTVTEGTKVGVVSKYGTWYLVNFEPDRFGWVSGQYLTDDLSWTPPAPPDVPASTPEPTPAVTSEPAAEPTPAATSEPAPEATPEPTPEATPEPTPEATPEPTPEATPEPTPELTPPPGGLASPGDLR